MCDIYPWIDSIIRYNISPNSAAALRKADGCTEAKLIQIACGTASDDHSRWTMKLLEEKFWAKLEIYISKEIIRRVLKNELQSHRNNYWCIPPKENTVFVSCMEDIPDIYGMPYDSTVLVVYMDEKFYQQLLDEAREPLPMSLGDTQKIDSEYVRKGICSIFMFVELLGGVRHVSVREHCVAADWVEEIKYLADISYPDKQKIIFVMDNLNTHAIAPPYKDYPAQEARLIARKLELH